jgi:hypothetical protein
VLFRRLTCLARAAALAAPAAASARAAQPTLTVSQYRHQANAICSDFDRFQLPTSGTLADRLAEGVDKGRASLAALRRLRPPRSLARLHAEILRAEDQRLELAGALIGRLKTGRITIRELAGKLGQSPAVAEANALWRQVGACSCVQY